jgi:hypothetical protein
MKNYLNRFIVEFDRLRSGGVPRMNPVQRVYRIFCGKRSTPDTKSTPAVAEHGGAFMGENEIRALEEKHP